MTIVRAINEIGTSNHVNGKGIQNLIIDCIIYLFILI
jgi:hypothetical protein